MKVLVTRRPPGRALEMLADQTEVDCWDEDRTMPHAELLARVADADGLYSMLTDRIDGSVIAAAPRLRAVSQMAVGVDNVDVAAFAAAGIPVGHTPDVLTDATADLAVALLLAGARRLPEGVAHVRAGRWGPWDPDLLMGAEVSASTVGIVGLGRIGRAVARRLAGFGCRLLAATRTRHRDVEADLGVTVVPFTDLLADADHVVLTVPLTSETTGLIDAAALARMRPTAGLVNVSRGGVVDTEALVEALATGSIAWAALDVTDPEPMPADHPLLALPRATVIPHLGSSTHRTRAAMAELAARNLIEALAGRPMPAQVG
ncbi:MAG: D-glycerate dehydrogenase [Acidimicrobiia bacterium]